MSRVTQFCQIQSNLTWVITLLNKHVQTIVYKKIKNFLVYNKGIYVIVAIFLENLDPLLIAKLNAIITAKNFAVDCHQLIFIEL